MIRRPPRSTLDRSSAASDVYKRQDTFPADLETLLKQPYQNITIGEKVSEQVGVIGEKIELADYQPVSYTHLRAHETVLDLVCRLLLENKKIKQTPLTAYVLQ